VEKLVVVLHLSLLILKTCCKGHLRAVKEFETENKTVYLNHILALGTLIFF